MDWHRSEEELESRLDEIKASPSDKGALEMIVVRPAGEDGLREELQECRVTVDGGFENDKWASGDWKTLPDGNPHPDVQVSLTNSRSIDVVTGQRERWNILGDNLYVDFDLSDDNLKCGDRLSIGSLVVEISDEKNTGCKSYGLRFGRAALKWINKPIGRKLHLRGVYARVIHGGVVRVGDIVTKL